MFTNATASTDTSNSQYCVMYLTCSYGTLLARSFIKSLALMIAYGSQVFLVVTTVILPSIRSNEHLISYTYKSMIPKVKEGIMNWHFNGTFATVVNNNLIFPSKMYQRTNIFIFRGCKKYCISCWNISISTLSFRMRMMTKKDIIAPFYHFIDTSDRILISTSLLDVSIKW